MLFDVNMNHQCVVLSMQVIEGSSPVPPTGETGEGVEPQGAEEDGPAADEEDTA